MSIAVALVFLTGISQLLSVGLQAGDIGRLRATAAKLASEGMEAMYNIRENGGISFTSGWSGLTSASDYYQPALFGGTWVLGSKSSASPPPAMPSPYGQFTRTVKIEAVRRDIVGLGCNGEVSDTGACDDANTRKVTVTVTWTERGVAKTYITVGLLTNI